MISRGSFFEPWTKVSLQLLLRQLLAEASLPLGARLGERAIGLSILLVVAYGDQDTEDASFAFAAVDADGGMHVGNQMPVLDCVASCIPILGKQRRTTECFEKKGHSISTDTRAVIHHFEGYFFL